MKNSLTPELVSTLCHDLRGPLGAIGTWVHVLSSGKARPETQTQALAAMSTDVQALGGLIEHLSILGSILSMKEPVRLESVDVIPLLRSAASSTPSGGDLQVEVQATETSLTVLADKARLGQLISLLASRGMTGRAGARQLTAIRDESRARIDVVCPNVPPRALSLALAEALCECQGGVAEALERDGHQGLSLTFPLVS